MRDIQKSGTLGLWCRCRYTAKKHHFRPTGVDDCSNNGFGDFQYERLLLQGVGPGGQNLALRPLQELKQIDMDVNLARSHI